jgi:hypothetical protein
VIRLGTGKPLTFFTVCLRVGELSRREVAYTVNLAAALLGVQGMERKGLPDYSLRVMAMFSSGYP